VVGGEVNPDHGPQGVADEGDPVDPFSLHEREEVRSVDRDAGLFLHPPCGSPSPQIHRQEPPAREPAGFQFLDERAEGVGTPGETVDQQGRVLRVGISPGDGSQVGARVGQWCLLSLERLRTLRARP
jgi:hypothetical protein